MKLPTSKRPATKPLRTAGLFAGIGGLELGLARAGFKTELLCEIDPAAQAVLRERFRGVELLNDVREIESIPRGIDVLCAGFPCQNLSSTGQKAGITGAHSSLVREVFRILSARPTEWVIIENVPFMLRLKHGEAIDTVARGLERLGYSWAYRVMDSQAFGLPHRRKRVFIVASLNNDPRQVLLGADSLFAVARASHETALSAPIGFYWTEGTYATGLAYNAVPPLKGGSTIGIPSPPAVLLENGEVCTPDIRDAERLQGFDADWTAPAEAVMRSSVRWRLVGNAVTVPVAQWVGKRIQNPSAYDGSADCKLRTSDWPDAAWSRGDGRFESEVSHFPVARSTPALDSFLRYPTRPLSVRATEGFLRRADAGNLRYPTGFIHALRKYVRRQVKAAV
jgi:DNA (cytosine-5)-methyltransferase 1